MPVQLSCEQEPEQKAIGLQLSSLREPLRNDAAGTLSRVAEMGYAFIEAAGYRDGLFYGLAPVDFRNLCESNGLAFLGSHTGRDLPEPGQWDETMAWWDKCIEDHAAAGVKWIVQPWMGREGYESLDGLKKYCEYWNVVGEKCNARGIRFGYHNHDREFSEIDGEVIFDFMLENMDPDKVMFQMDLYWCAVAGRNPADYFRQYPGRFEIWHIKSSPDPGEGGVVDLAALWELAGLSGMQYGVVEVEEYTKDPFESIRWSFEYLNTSTFAVFPE